MSKPKKLLLVIRHAPYGNQLARESLEAALAASVYEQELTLLFLDDGVLQLMPNQQAEGIGQKSIEKMLAAFPLYEIDRLFCCADSLSTRGLSTDGVGVDIQTLDTAGIQNLFSQQETILSF